jgi:methyl-accepting chemotaxis protein
MSMTLRASITIERSLYLSFALIFAVTLGLAGVDMAKALSERAEASRTAELAAADLDVFEALAPLRNERSAMQIALGDAKPADAATKADIAEKRKASARGLGTLIERCRQIACGAGGAVAGLTSLIDTLPPIRAAADAALEQDGPARPPGLIKQWKETLSRVVDALSGIAAALSAQTRDIDITSATLVGIEDASYRTRDAIGFQRYPIADYTAKRQVPQDEHDRLVELVAKAAENWQNVVNLTAAEPFHSQFAGLADKVNQTYFDTFAKQRTAIVAAAQAGSAVPISPEAADAAVVGSMDAAIAVTRHALDLLIQHAEQKHDEVLAAVIVRAALLLVVLAVGGLLASIIHGRVARPLTRITRAMQRVTAGELEVENPDSARTDEIGHLARALDAFKQNLRATNALTVQREEERRIKERRAEALEKLVRNFDVEVAALVKSLTSAATEMQGTANALAASADRTNTQSSAVATAATQASANVQTIATATEQLAVSVQEIGRRVSDSRSIATRAINESDETGKTVRQLSDSVQQIGQVVQLISHIANQTNLLALNATIEAARAGDAGRGFAVVANEVKSLANQTADATGKIEKQIGDMQGLMAKTVAAIQGINTTIGRMSEIAIAIATAVEEQNAATQEIARSVSDAAKGTQQVSSNIADVHRASASTGAAASQILGASINLSKQADHLDGEVSQFITGVTAA